VIIRETRQEIIKNWDEKNHRPSIKNAKSGSVSRVDSYVQSQCHAYSYTS